MKLYTAKLKHRDKSNDHSYIVGIFDNERDAEYAARLEAQAAPFKYEATVETWLLNTPNKSWSLETHLSVRGKHG